MVNDCDILYMLSGARRRFSLCRVKTHRREHRLLHCLALARSEEDPSASRAAVAATSSSRRVNRSWVIFRCSSTAFLICLHQRRTKNALFILATKNVVRTSRLMIDFLPKSSKQSIGYSMFAKPRHERIIFHLNAQCLLRDIMCQTDR